MFTLWYSGYCQNTTWEFGLGGAPIIFSADELNGLFYFTLKPDIGAGYGVEAKRSVGERSKVGIGVNLSSLRYGVDYDFIVPDPDDSFFPEKSIVISKFIEIPLSYNYKLLEKGKYSLYGSAGITPSFFLSSQENTIYGDKTKRPSSYSSSNTFTKTNVSGDIGVGLSADMGQRISVSFEPTINYFFKGFIEGINDNPILLRSALGVTYKISKNDNKIEVE